ncbi:glycoside hydrolase [Pseudoxanthomonas broegbernensis]|uniref:Glycoside hydrolase n=1 Tax=Pseudoxanthomonas broegbernensis TaxID=83619 RepID=A0A7V8K871_9GAMM|nr:glycoside hydrolase family 5 protein [Pseudoxanthomonas broegbernensis]KAF1688054.1 glycoside hydrolase [Pseudoxanthomonas broegbernensis]MBB6065083.1 endoglucanase [Pseudoxanthomonas broegbernensis]
MSRTAGVAVAMWLALAAIVPHAAAQAPGISAAEQVARMGAGVNILGYDPYWRDGGQGNYREEHFKAIHDAGFRTVRVVLFTFRHLDEAGTLDPAWLEKLDWVVAMGKRHGLVVVLDVHDFDDCAKDMAGCVPRLEKVWSQLAARYADEPDSLVFELLNEPHGQLDADAWNALFPQLLRIVRASNPTRNVVIGPVGWNGFRYLDPLELPEDDRHLIATFHYYEPFDFTHQGADWVGPEISGLKDVPFGTPGQIAQIGKDFDAVKAWSLKHDRPILLGEFGAYDRAPMEGRVLWTATVARAAEARGFAHAYWQFSSDFVLYDFEKQAWVEPILRAIIPDSKVLPE